MVLFQRILKCITVLFLIIVQNHIHNYDFNIMFISYFYQQVIASLKGLANVQLITDDVAAKLVQCAEDSNVKTRVRSAALSAYRTNDLVMLYNHFY